MQLKRGLKQIPDDKLQSKQIFMKDLKNETLPCRPKEHTGDRCTSYRSSRKHSASHGGSHICEGPQQWFHAAFFTHLLIYSSMLYGILVLVLHLGSEILKM